MTKELRKEISTWSKLKNKCNRNPTEENKAIYKKQRNKCVSLRRKAIRFCLNNVTKTSVQTNKEFWKLIKPFLTKTRKSFANYEIIKDIKENNIAKNLTVGNSHLPKVSACDVEQLLRNIDSKKPTGIDKIPPKLIKLSEKILSKPLAIAINNIFNKGMFPDNVKIACVSPLDKLTYSATNFRPVSVLSTFSSIFQKIVKRLFWLARWNITFHHLFTHTAKSFSTEHVLIRLLEDWRNILDNNNVVGVILTDLSKAFDCIPHDLLVTKLDTYGFNRDTVA